MNPQEHIDHVLDDWLDGRLSAEEGQAVSRHLDACEACRSLADGLRLTRQVLREDVGDPALPDGLEAGVFSALDREDEATRASARGSRTDSPPLTVRPRRWRTWIPLAAALAVAALAGFLFALRETPRPIDGPPDPVPAARQPGAVDAVFADYAAVLKAPAAFEVESAEALAHRWQQANLDFPVRVLDLSEIGVPLVGGAARALGGQPAAMALYQGLEGLIACWMFPGEEADLPPPLAEHERGEFRFKVYRRGDASLVVWREGDVLCALAAPGEVQQVLDLAFAKAMAPAFT